MSFLRVKKFARANFQGSARVSRAGFGVSPKRSFNLGGHFAIK